MRRYLVTATPFIYTALFAGAILLSIYAGLHYGLWAAVAVMASAFILLVVPGIIIGVPDPDDDWHWEQFAKQFDRQKLPSQSDCDLFDSPIAVPWQASFNKSVPERIGFTSTGPVEIR